MSATEEADDPLAQLAAALTRWKHAQAAVDSVLTPAQQRAEAWPDGSYRVRCSRCGASVSNPLPVPAIVRAWVTCVDCTAAGTEQGRDG